MTKTTTIKRYKASFYDTDTNELVREFVQETDDFGAFVKRCENRCEWNEVWYYTELSDEDAEPETIDVRDEDETEQMHRRSRADHLRDEVARHQKDIADASAIRSETLKELAELAASEDADYQSIRALADRIARCENRIEVSTAYRDDALFELFEPEDAFIDGPVSVRIADDSVSFKAEFLANDEWNGWVLPYFSREELEKVIRHMNKIGYGEFHTFCLTTDEYRVTNYSDGSLIEAFKGIDKNGKHVYPIGTGIWSWEVAEVD